MLEVVEIPSDSPMIAQLGHQGCRTGCSQPRSSESSMIKVSLAQHINLSLCTRSQTSWVPTRPDTNRAVQSKKKSRSLKFRIHKKKRNCTIRVAKTKALISSAVTIQLICAFVFAIADC